MTDVGEFAQTFVERLRAKAPGPDAELAPPPTEFEIRWDAEIPWRFRQARPELLEESVGRELATWGALKPPTSNLILCGPVGTGKTFAGVAALRIVGMVHEASFAFSPVVELLDRLRPGGDGDALLDRLARVRVLLLDDLGVEKGSEWTAERLYALVNRRWLEGRPTIVTTNLEPHNLEAAIDARLYSRLVDGAVALRLTGKDRRRA